MCYHNRSTVHAIFQIRNAKCIDGHFSGHIQYCLKVTSQHLLHFIRIVLVLALELVLETCSTQVLNLIAMRNLCLVYSEFLHLGISALVVLLYPE